MLVLTRRVGEGITVTLPDGRTMRVMVASVRENGAIRVGIEAPEDCHIVRDELLKRDEWDGWRRSLP
jgi:carbon storage regulator CsrA